MEPLPEGVDVPGFSKNYKNHISRFFTFFSFNLNIIFDIFTQIFEFGLFYPVSLSLQDILQFYVMNSALMDFEHGGNSVRGKRDRKTELTEHERL